MSNSERGVAFSAEGFLYVIFLRRNVPKKPTQVWFAHLREGIIPLPAVSWQLLPLSLNCKGVEGDPHNPIRYNLADRICERLMILLVPLGLEILSKKNGSFYFLFQKMLSKPIVFVVNKKRLKIVLPLSIFFLHFFCYLLQNILSFLKEFIFCIIYLFAHFKGVSVCILASIFPNIGISYFGLWWINLCTFFWKTVDRSD